MAIAGSCSDYKQITMPIDTPLAASYACIYGGHSGVRSVTDLDWSYMLWRIMLMWLLYACMDTCDH